MRRYWPDEKVGDTRVKSGFLLFPRCIGTDMRWLEWHAWEEKLIEYDGWSGKTWQATRWLTK